MSSVKFAPIQLYTRPIPAYCAMIKEDGGIEMLGPHKPMANDESGTVDELYATAHSYPDKCALINEPEVESTRASSANTNARTQLNETCLLAPSSYRPIPTHCVRVDEDSNIVKLGAFDVASLESKAPTELYATAYQYSRPIPSQEAQITEAGDLKTLSQQFKNISVCR